MYNIDEQARICPGMSAAGIPLGLSFFDVVIRKEIPLKLTSYYQVLACGGSLLHMVKGEAVRFIHNRTSNMFSADGKLKSGDSELRIRELYGEQGATPLIYPVGFEHGNIGIVLGIGTRIAEIHVFGDYRGSTKEGIMIGSSIADIKRHGEVQYDDDISAFRWVNRKGLGFKIDELTDKRINGMFVYLEDIEY